MFGLKVLLLLAILFITKKTIFARMYTNDSCFADTTAEMLSNLFELTTEESQSLLDELDVLQVPKSDVQFYLYTVENEYEPLNSSESLSRLNPSYPTKILIHGWSVNVTYPWLPDMASAFHKKGEVNTILIDWSKQGNQNYVHAMAASQLVGYIIGDFIVGLNKKYSISLKNIHVIGHSMGAQIAGFAGKRVFNETGSKVSRGTGLDAAGPLYETPTVKNSLCRLADTDYNFTDLIHTTDGIGVVSPYGKADFFVNGGFSQLNCTDKLPNIFKSLSCDHNSAPVYYIESITNPEAYPARACSNSITFKAGLCNHNQIAYMGDGVSDSTVGTYYISIDEDGNAKN